MSVPVELTRQQAFDASKLCLQNARDYLEDAKMYYEKRRLQHIRIPFEFALEESGKFRAMYDQLQQGNTIISMNYKMRKGHQIKVDYIKQFVKVSSKKEGYYEDVWTQFPFLSPDVNPVFTGKAENMRTMVQRQRGLDVAKKFVKLDQDILHDLIDAAHDKRLGTLVNFDDNTFDPKLDPPMREGDCDLLIDTIENMLNSFDFDFSKIQL